MTTKCLCCMSNVNSTILVGLLELLFATLALISGLLRMNDGSENKIALYIGCGLALVAGGCLIFGALRENIHFFYAWQVINALETCAFIVQTIISFVHDERLWGALYVVFLCIIRLYMMLIVFGAQRELKHRGCEPIV